MRRPARLARKVRNWDLHDARAVEEIERLNLLSQKCVAAALVRYLLTKANRSRGKFPPMPDEKSLFQLHRAGTLFLLDKPARYRDVGMELARHSDGKIVYRAPPPRQVKKLMKQFFRELTTLWTKGDALDVAAYAAWRLGWIHPFLDGNGRTARLFAYACLCVRLGGALPDTYTLVDQISSDQDRWVRLLLAANRSFERGALNLRPLKRYLDELLLKQIRSAE